ncbi:hypothetical protein, partial [Pseudomonas aeruginosa]|uniref:hypothetical protein n=1 Tax=Pseudomonas aeruginosa TaxID=287 RepID=UPI001A9D1C1A
SRLVLRSAAFHGERRPFVCAAGFFPRRWSRLVLRSAAFHGERRPFVCAAGFFPRRCRKAPSPGDYRTNGSSIRTRSPPP